jgi:hypothetical protein
LNLRIRGVPLSHTSSGHGAYLDKNTSFRGIGSNLLLPKFRTSFWKEIFLLSLESNPLEMLKTI